MLVSDTLTVADPTSDTMLYYFLLNNIYNDKETRSSKPPELSFKFMNIYLSKIKNLSKGTGRSLRDLLKTETNKKVE